jgi:hypothetical protein
MLVSLRVVTQPYAAGKENIISMIARLYALTVTHDRVAYKASRTTASCVETMKWLRTYKMGRLQVYSTSIVSAIPEIPIPSEVGIHDGQDSRAFIQVGMDEMRPDEIIIPDHGAPFPADQAQV